MDAICGVLLFAPLLKTHTRFPLIPRYADRYSVMGPPISISPLEGMIEAGQRGARLLALSGRLIRRSAYKPKAIGAIRGICSPRAASARPPSPPPTTSLQRPSPQSEWLPGQSIGQFGDPLRRISTPSPSLPPPGSRSDNAPPALMIWLLFSRK